MDKRDYYQVLGTPKNSPDADLKKAYRRLAMKFHPDRNPGDQEAEKKFKEAKEAYEVLSDPQKRSAYDQFGHAGVDSSSGMGGGTGAAGFGDVFGVQAPVLVAALLCLIYSIRASRHLLRQTNSLESSTN